VNNAGIIQDQRQESADGHELTVQVNYLAGVLLRHRLLCLLKGSAPARIINVALAGQAPIDFSNVSGRYFDGDQEARIHPQADDRAARTRLRDLSRKLCGLVDP
jgi:short-subunit dehydrogenase involved in D-alanine esterification of teichoic acids